MPLEITSTVHVKDDWLIFIEYLPDQFRHHLSLSMADNKGIIFINQKKGFNVIISPFMTLPAVTFNNKLYEQTKWNLVQILLILVSSWNLMVQIFSLCLFWTFFSSQNHTNSLKCKVLKLKHNWRKRFGLFLRKYTPLDC